MMFYELETAFGDFLGTMCSCGGIFDPLQFAYGYWWCRQIWSFSIRHV